jgi:D-alanine-D-alanine ligase
LDLLTEFGFPLILKPCHEGSSIGISVVHESTQLEQAWREACQYDDFVLAERWIQGLEYTAAILGDQALPLIRLETPHTIYDYQAKYESTTTGYFIPCGLDSGVEREMQKLALEAFDLAGASGWGRVDFMIDEEGLPWLIEANTVPGMTDHSLVPIAAKAAGMDFDELVWQILAQTLEIANG